MRVKSEPYVQVDFLDCPYCAAPITVLTGLDIQYCPYCGKELEDKEVLGYYEMQRKEVSNG